MITMLPKWRETTVQRVLRLLDRPAKAGLGVITAYRDGAVTLRSNRREDGYTFSDTENGYQEIRPGDLVFHALDGFAGAVGVSDSHGNGSPVYHVCEPGAGDDPAYLARLLRHLGTSGFLATQAPNVRERSVDFRNWSTFARIPLVLPPADEQRAIADYLDGETARIDTLIAEQQRLIEMLRERRESEIRSTLLAGLEDAAPRRSSGVALLGDIPSHWQMVPARYLCTITTGSEDSGNATDDGDYPFYVRGREVLRIDHYSFDGEAVMTPGDGQGGTGKVFHYVNEKFEAHQRVYVFKDFVGISGWYFYYFLSAFLRPVALAGSNTVTMESLRRPLLADFRVAVPPLEEQHQITAYLDERIAKIDMLIAETVRFIELARERRSALITATVTGQIDVREMA